MTFTETKLKGCFILEPKIFKDERGYFMESFNERTFQEGIGQKVTFVQDNQSFSTKGVLRGLHYQCGEHAQAKLVRVLQGEVLDVAVDLRAGSPTFGQWYGVELTEENHLQFLVPQGFAHGFSVLSETAIFSYKCDDFYNPALERGIMYNDPALNIDWKIPADKALISEKDTKHPLFIHAEKNF